MQVGIGSPSTEYTLLLDTGSSNTWIGSRKKYVRTSASKDSGKDVNVKYGSGGFRGREFTDVLDLVGTIFELE